MNRDVPTDCPPQSSHTMLTIQRARETDIEEMHRIQMLAFEAEGRRCGTRELPPLQEPPASILDHVRTQIALVARQGDAVVGCIRGVIAGHTCTIRGLVVEPSRHGRGIGSALLRALEAELRDIRRIELETNAAMEANVRFYERHGYRVHDSTEPIPGIRLAHLEKCGPFDNRNDELPCG